MNREVRIERDERKKKSKMKKIEVKVLQEKGKKKG